MVAFCFDGIVLNKKKEHLDRVVSLTNQACSILHFFKTRCVNVAGMHKEAQLSNGKPSNLPFTRTSADPTERSIGSAQ